MHDPSEYPDHDEALRLIARIRAGSVPDWHHMVDAYSGLIFGVIRRYLGNAGPDEQRSMYALVLERLYHGGLDGYAGRCRLSTWLFVFVRSRCLDHLRSRFGRRAVPRWLKRLCPLDQQVYRLYYLLGLKVEEVCRRLSTGGEPLALERLAESLERLEANLDNGALKRMAYDLQARSIGLTSGRLLEYLHALKIEREIREDGWNPECQLLEQEARRTLRLVSEYVNRLPDIERKVIALRFYEGCTARKTAERLNLDGARRVYTVERRAIDRLGGMLKA